MHPSESPSEPKPTGKPGEIVVFMVRRETKCAECGRELFDGNLLRVENKRPLCLDCADLGHLEFLASGNTALTRRATKHSPLRAVVVRWARARKRYERQGILATPESIEQAESECLADEDSRARQRERSAAAKEFDPQALRLAVIAHIRHEHTRYDELLMRHGDRAFARELVRGGIDSVLARWEKNS